MQAMLRWRLAVGSMMTRQANYRVEGVSRATFGSEGKGAQQVMKWSL